MTNRPAISKKALIFCLSLWGCFSTGLSQKVAEVNASTEFVDAFTLSEFIESPYDSIRPGYALRHGKEFTSYKKLPGTLLYNSTKSFWFRFSFKNTGEKQAYFFMPNYNIRNIKIYLLKNDSTLAEHTGGIIKMSAKTYKNNNLICDLPVADTQTYTVLVNMQHITLPHPHFFVASSPEVMHISHQSDIFHGIYFGFILVIIVYNLVLFFQIRELEHLVYSILALTLGLMIAQLYGYAPEFIFPENPGYLNYINAFQALAGIVALIFAIVFFKLHKEKNNWYRAALIFIGIFLISFGIECAGGLGEYFIYFNPGVVVLWSNIFLFATGIRAYRKGFKPAIYYLISNFFLFLFIFVFFGYAYGMLPYSFFAYNSLSLGSGLELLFFSIALAVKLNSFKRDKEIAEQQKIALLEENQKLVSEQKEKLEVLVKERTHELEVEKERSDDLLLNILPESIAEELKHGGQAKAEYHENVSVMFCDLKNFTQIAESLEAEVLVKELNHLFTLFDSELEAYGVEKIKTIGDAYMCATGLYQSADNSAESMVRYSLALRNRIVEFNKAQTSRGIPEFKARFGIHTGPVIAGVVGIKKFQYDIWGDTVNLAARMEEKGEAGKINISGATFDRVKLLFDCEHRGKISAKNKGEIDMYFAEPKNA